MIGDTLFDCGEDLDRYLSHYEWPVEVEYRVRRLREEIRYVQRWLDEGSHETFANIRLSNAGRRAAAAIATRYASRG